MAWEELLLRYTEAGREYNAAFHQRQGDAMARGLAEGQIVLRDAMYLRLHDDVERVIGVDSMFVPVSEQRSLRQTKSQIELFQIAELTDWAGQSAYLGAEIEPFWRWLLKHAREAGSADSDAKTVAAYLALAPRQRHLAFTDVLVKAFPEARRAPLVLFRLFPLAVRLATSQAFGDEPAAELLRNQQLEELPAIADCRRCRGRLLPIGEMCRDCGNPLWKGEWLNVSE